MRSKCFLRLIFFELRVTIKTVKNIMLTKKKYDKYVQILKEELVPAMGCTEPAAIAFAGAKARRILGEQPTSALIEVSGNIIKNVKSVCVPKIGKLKGIDSALAAGIAVGDANESFEVLAKIKKTDISKIKQLKEDCKITVKKANSPCVFEISVTLESQNHSSFVKITETHTNVVCIKKDGVTIYENTARIEERKADRSFLNVKDVVAFADELKIDDVKEIFDRQIKYNMAIAEEGLNKNYGANIGKVLLNAYPDDVKIKAKAYAAAGSDARMNGCDMPVIINSGSGNQGMTASVPVIVYARHLNSPIDLLYRALAVSNLIAIHLKSGVGTLSAYCGVVSAGAGAGCGICYLYGGKFKDVAHTLVNTLAIDSGIICDGAKGSCAGKIAMAVDCGILGYEMYKSGNEFHSGDGIVKKGVENTIASVSKLAKFGMQKTDEEILKIMIEDFK